MIREITLIYGMWLSLRSQAQLFHCCWSNILLFNISWSRSNNLDHTDGVKIQYLRSKSGWEIFNNAFLTSSCFIDQSNSRIFFLWASQLHPNLNFAWTSFPLGQLYFIRTFKASCIILFFWNFYTRQSLGEGKKRRYCSYTHLEIGWLLQVDMFQIGNREIFVLFGWINLENTFFKNVF